MPDYYAVLGIDKNATPTQIKAAYKKLALKYHPDKSAGASPDVVEHNASMFKQVNEANGVLSDPKLRKEYDKNPQTFSSNSMMGAPLAIREKPHAKMKKDKAEETPKPTPAQQSKKTAKDVADEINKTEDTGDTAKTLMQTAQMMPGAAKSLAGSLKKGAHRIKDVLSNVAQKVRKMSSDLPLNPAATSETLGSNAATLQQNAAASTAKVDKEKQQSSAANAPAPESGPSTPTPPRS